MTRNVANLVRRVNGVLIHHNDTQLPQERGQFLTHSAGLRTLIPYDRYFRCQSFSIGPHPSIATPEALGFDSGIDEVSRLSILLLRILWDLQHLLDRHGEDLVVGFGEIGRVIVGRISRG